MNNFETLWAERWPSNGQPAIMNEAFKSLAKEFYNKGLIQAVEACMNEHLTDPTENEGDVAYDQAILHCIEAISSQFVE